MLETGDLFDDFFARPAPIAPEPEPYDEFETMAERFARWNKLNARVYPLFRGLALQLIDRGRRKISAKAIIERIRWEVAVRTEGEPWKLNNSYTAFYARMFMVEHPEHADIFETRSTKEDHPDSFYRACLADVGAA